MIKLTFENKQGGVMDYSGYMYDYTIRVSEDKDRLEIYNPAKNEAVMSVDLNNLQGIRIRNTIKESTLEWLESFIREYAHVYEYWKKEIAAAWAIHDIITHNEAVVPCESEYYRGYEGIED